MALPKVLIVDDDPANITVLADILSPDYETFAVKSGTEALERIEAENMPDLILLDVQMPEMYGYELCRKIKKNPEVRHVPVIFITALSDTQSETQGLACGAQDYISRPFNPAVVKARVQTQMEVARIRRVSENRYQALFDNAADGILIFDFQNHILEVNTAFCKKIGYSREELLQMHHLELNTEQDKQLFKDSLEQVKEQGESLLEGNLLCKEGNMFPVEMNVKQIEFDDKPALLAVCRDITRRKQAEEQMLKYRTRLEELLASRTKELQEQGQTLARLERDLKKRKQFRKIIGQSEVMQSLYSRLEDLANVDTTVLITGESGVGKELVAEALHYGGIWHKQPFVRIACSDLAEYLIESELFGHVRGAFTGAIRNRIGRFEKAGKGTVFLDEIGDIPKRFQQRLLRVLEQRTLERVGCSKTIAVKARIIAATNKDLEQMVREQSFRQDLYYRFKVVEIKLPPLRERKEDIPLLVDHFLALFTEEFKKDIKDVSPEALRQLMLYDWPGNIRELRHVLESASIMCKTDLIEVKDLPKELTAKNSNSSVLKLEKNNITLEPETIRSALVKSGGNKAKAARLIGISRRHFYRKLKKFGIEDYE